MMIKDIKITNGRLIVVSFSRDCPYISTLNEAYYDSTNGKKLLELIQEYRPGIYVELHTYKRDNHSNLIDPDRRNKIGVPPLPGLKKKFSLVLFHLSYDLPNSGEKIFALPLKCLILILKRH